jgi:hypothetical protein
MAYCTYTDVQLEAGTSLGTLTTANITDLITESDAEINDQLLLRGLAAPSSSTTLKRASKYLTIAKIKRRQAHELSRPNSLGLGSISFGTSPEAEAMEYERKAAVEIKTYLGINRDVEDTTAEAVTRCDAVMDDFKLDQATDPVFFTVVESEDE